MSLTISLPDIPSLKGEENIMQWNQLLIGHLRLHGLEQYILETVVPPTAGSEACKEHDRNRAKINLLLMGTLQHPDVFHTLINRGWKLDEKDPKVTYDTVIKEIPRMSIENKGALIREFTRIDAGQFETFDKFMVALRNCKQRIESQNIGIDKSVMVYIALLAIQPHYPAQYMMWSRDHEAGKMSWEDLMREFGSIALTQRTTTGAVGFYQGQGKPQGGAKGNNGEGNNNAKPKNKKGDCLSCEKPIYSDMRHCKGCNHHIKKKAQTCWWCNPEKADDGWKWKAKALQDKKNLTKSGDATQSATRQNSNLNAPSTASGAYLQWSSSLLNVKTTPAGSSPDFHRSPRY